MTDEDNGGCPLCGSQVGDANVHEQWHEALQKQMRKAARQVANKRQRQLDRSESEPQAAE